MRGGWTGGTIAIPLVALALAGCRGNPPPPLKPVAAPTAAPLPSGPFAELLQIGQEIEAEQPTLLARTFFFPAHRKRIESACAPKLSRLTRALAGGVEFAYAPQAMAVSGPARRGWRMMGRHLVWSLEDELKAGQRKAAAWRYGVATRFGFELTGGGASDVSLGLAISDEARRAIAPELGKMDAQTLDLLAKSTEEALRSKPPLLNAVKNEVANMRLLLQNLQDAYEKKRLPEEAQPLGSFVADDATYVQNLSREKAAVFFNSLGQEIDALEKELGADTAIPAPNRTWVFEPKGSRGRMLRRAVLGGVSPVLRMNDVTLARTRILLAECRLRARTLRGQALPRRLDELGKGLFGDPFSGYDLVYRRAGKAGTVYSVGEDGKDDGGLSDASGVDPDLTLEAAK